MRKRCRFIHAKPQQPAQPLNPAVPPTPFRRFFWGLEAFSIFAAVLCGLALAYWFTPSYMEFATGEPMVTVGAEQWLQGYPLYTVPSGTGSYSTLYGPATYLSTALGLLLFNDPIFGSKCAGIVLCLVTTVLFTIAAKRSLRWSETLFALGLFSIQSLMLHEFCFGMAANPLLTFTAVLGLFSMTLSNWNLRLGVLGVATGLAMASKLHGPLYLLPAWVIFLHEGGWKRTTWCGLLAVALFFLPFLLPGISLRNHLAWIAAINHHAFQWHMLTTTLIAELLFGGLILVLLVAPRKDHWWDLEGRTRWLAQGLALGFVIVLVPAAKEGAGPHHLWPFLPWISYLLASWLQSIESRGAPSFFLHTIRAGFLAWTFSLALCVPGQIDSVLVFVHQSPERVSILADLKSILSRYPNHPIQMGCGSDASSSPTYFRPLVYQRPGACLIDGAGACELAAGRIDLTQTEASILNHTDNLWLIPTNETPFTITNWYEPHGRVFAPTFTEAFLARYRKVDQSAYFDIYGASDIQPGP